MLTESGRRVFEARYAARDDGGRVAETFEQAVYRLARAVARAEKQDAHHWEERYAQVVGDLLFVPSTPVWANVGKPDRPWQPAACFVLSVEDSLESMYETLKHTALVFKSGGGVGYNFSSIRPRGSLVRTTKGQASGVVELIRLYDSSSNMVMQGGVRRGASIGILNAHHPEIFEFINAKLGGGFSNFNLSVGVSDAFMEALEKGGDWELSFNGAIHRVVPAAELWEAVVKAAHACGDPGLVFLDALQRGNPLPGTVLEATNPCVSGDTWVLTSAGPRRARSLVGRQLAVAVNGEYLQAGGKGFFCTGRKPVHLLATCEGYSVKLTSDHLVLRFRNAGSYGLFEWVPAGRLQRGDRLVMHAHAGLSWGGPLSEADGYRLGRELCASESPGPEALERAESSSSAGHRGFLRAAFAGTGSVEPGPGGVRVRVTLPEAMVEPCQRMLLRLGVFSAVWTTLRGEPAGLVVPPESAGVFAREVGFSDDRQCRLPGRTGAGDAAPPRFYLATLESFRPAGLEEVYDVSVPGANAFDANGFFVHNCGEQPLLPGESCLLGSVNLARMVGGDGELKEELLAETARLGVRFLDGLIDVAEYPLPSIAEKTRASRKVGLGFTGLADALIKAGLPYDSEEGRKFAARVTAVLQEAAHEASRELAAEKGVFPLWEQSVFYPEDRRRNAACVTIAPTGSVTALAGCEGYGVEPIFAVAYRKATAAAGEFEVFSPLFLEACRERGVGPEALAEVARRGSCQGVPGVPLDLQRLFKGAQEISPEDHILMQAAVQMYVDNAVSKTVNLPQEARVEDVDRCYRLAHRLGLKGITVFRDGCKEGTVTVGQKEGGAGRELKRGEILPRPLSAHGMTHRLDTGCGKIYLTVNYQPQSGEVLETFITTGSDGGCLIYTEATSRLVSLAIRGGIPVGEIIEQLHGTHPCPSFMLAKGRGKDLSPGKSCPSAIAHKLEEVLAELSGRCGGPAGCGERAAGGGPACPDCGGRMELAEGCMVCPDCGYSKC